MDELFDADDEESERALEESLFYTEHMVGAPGVIDIEYISEESSEYIERTREDVPPFGAVTTTTYHREDQIETFLDKCRDFFAEYPGQVMDVDLRAEDDSEGKRYEAWIVYWHGDA